MATSIHNPNLPIARVLKHLLFKRDDSNGMMRLGAVYFNGNNCERRLRILRSYVEHDDLAESFCDSIDKILSNESQLELEQFIFLTYSHQEKNIPADMLAIELNYSNPEWPEDIKIISHFLELEDGLRLIRTFMDTDCDKDEPYDALCQKL